MSKIYYFWNGIRYLLLDISWVFLGGQLHHVNWLNKKKVCRRQLPYSFLDIQSRVFYYNTIVDIMINYLPWK